MTAYEIVQMAYDTCDGDTQELIQCLNELLFNLRNDTDRFIRELDEQVEKIAEDDNRCPLCGEKLETKNYYEKSEYQGFEVAETISENQCPNC